MDGGHNCILKGEHRFSDAKMVPFGAPFMSKDAVIISRLPSWKKYVTLSNKSETLQDAELPWLSDLEQFLMRPC